MKKENYKLRKKLIKTGGSSYLVIPAVWLQEQAERLNVKVIEKLELMAFDDCILIRPLSNKQIMAPKEIDSEAITDAIAKIFKKLDQLEAGMKARFDKLKAAIIGYIDLGSEMAKGSVRETLKAI